MDNDQLRAQLADYVSSCAFDLLDFPVERENVQVYTVRSPHNFSKPLIELSQALLQGLAEVTEVNEHGSVQNLFVINRSEVYLLIYEGSLLKGAKQNRIVNATVVLPPKSETVIPASCVEAGRWSYSSPSFSKSPIDAPSSLRSRLRGSISSSKSLLGSQAAIWDEIRFYSAKNSINSPTSDFEDIYTRSSKSEQLFPDGLNIPPTKGIIVKGKNTCHMDYVANEAAFKEVVPRLVAGYELTSLSKSQEEGQDLKEFILKSVQEGEVFAQPSLSSATDIRIKSSLHHISALVHDDEIVSISITSAS